MHMYRMLSFSFCFLKKYSRHMVCMLFCFLRLGTLQECTADTLLVLVHFGIYQLDKANISLDLFHHPVQSLLVDTFPLYIAHMAFLLLQVGMEGNASCHCLPTSQHHTLGMLIVL